MGNALTQNMASVYLQRRLGGPSEYLGECVDLDSIPSPKHGGIEYIWCKDGRGGWRKKGKRKSPPGNIEFSLSFMSEADYRLVEDLLCPFNLYVLWSECGANGVMMNWDRGAAVIGAELNDDILNNVAHHIDQNELMNELPVTAAPPRLDYRRLTAGRSTTAEAYALNAVTNAATLFCGDKCGSYRLPSDLLYAVADGDVAASANVQFSDDGGITWAPTAADPFGVAIDLLSVTVFDINRDTQRILVARGTVAATPMAVAYSDDGGATWTLVTVGATNAEAATGPRSLWSLDSEHIWLATDSGNIYFSSDAGQTWTAQDAITAGGANPLNCVHFIDEMIGIAAGDADTVIFTVNGGLTWQAGTATGTGSDLTSCWIFDKQRAFVGATTDALGVMWMTWDGGASWESKVFDGYTTHDVTDFYFYNEARGFMVTTLAAVSHVFFTIDGGHLWEEMVFPDNDSINAILLTSVNKVVAVGEVETATAYIAKAN